MNSLIEFPTEEKIFKESLIVIMKRVSMKLVGGCNSQLICQINARSYAGITRRYSLLSHCMKGMSQ